MFRNKASSAEMTGKEIPAAVELDPPEVVMNENQNK